MTYRGGGIGGNAPAGPRGRKRSTRPNLDRVLAVAAFIVAVGHVVWEVV